MRVLFTQFNIIYALILREVHTLYGHTSLGYLWALFQSAFGIGVFWLFRLFLHAKAPHGMTILTYLVAGFGVWNIFSDIISKGMHAIDGNRNLLTFPHITPIDVVLARSIVICGTHITSMYVLLLIGELFGFTIVVSQPNLLIYAILLTVCFSLGMSIILVSLSTFLNFIPNIISMILRLLFFVSGVFFSVTMFSQKIGDFLLLNPVMQLIELARISMSSGYESHYVDLNYLCYVTLVVLSLGLLLERYTRKRQQS